MPDHKARLLNAYREKRQVDGTPEPFGRGSAADSGPLRFVVHHHAARNMHFDLRLEMEGVLRSWAVPKGPSPNINDKRFAALVEDHPLEYGDFEGRIPDGNYGAGWTILWDMGVLKYKGDPLEGLAKGKLLFELQGQKLHGYWTLVRMKSGEKDWLFIKETDEHMDRDGSTADYPMNSVYTGLSLAQLDVGYQPEKVIARSLARSKVIKRPVKVDKPMLATAGEAFSHKDWVYEIKYDGYRLLCVKQSDDTRLISRNGNDLSAAFPEIVQAVSRLPFSSFMLDGEVVVHNASGLPDFALMQKRGRLNKSSAIAAAVRNLPATLYAFDLLALGEFDLRSLTLEKRKLALRKVLPAPGIIKYSEHMKADGIAMFNAASEMGLEGIVAKKASAGYVHGRSPSWIKVRTEKTDDFVVMGFRQAANGDIRSLMVGQYIDEDLVYSGNVGSGLNQANRKLLNAELQNAPDNSPPPGAPTGQDLVWKDSGLVCEVKFKELTPAGQLRHPVLQALRDDKSPAECRRESKTRELAEISVETEVVQKNVQLSNLDKVFWPEEKLTKGDMITYYEMVSPWLLPWLADRPLVMTRFPDGITGKSFFQKDAPGFVPDWLRVEKMWSESTQREIGYMIIDSVESLLYVANMGCIPLHVYHSRTTHLEQPDWCVIDLDPKQAPFADVIKVARAIHRLCEDIGLPNFVKTSGSTGLHILLPLNRQFTFEESRILGELLGRIIVSQHPDIATITRNPARRDGKVYIDYLQNGSGKLIASAYCVRPIDNAPVSMPLRWREVDNKLTPRRYHIRNAARRLAQMKADPALAVLTESVDLGSVLEALSVRFAEMGPS